MDIPLISPRKLDQYVDRYPGIWIVDVRSGEEYRRSHIRHAVNIPYEPGQILGNCRGEKRLWCTVNGEPPAWRSPGDDPPGLPPPFPWRAELQNIKEEILTFRTIIVE